MLMRFNKFLDNASNFLAARKGLLPILGILLVLVDAVIQFLPAGGWLAQTNLLLHLGVILALIGIMLAWAL